LSPPLLFTLADYFVVDFVELCHNFRVFKGIHHFSSTCKKEKDKGKKRDIERAEIASEK
jgi:hypothetical protein